VIGALQIHIRNVDSCAIVCGDIGQGHCQLTQAIPVACPENFSDAAAADVSDSTAQAKSVSLSVGAMVGIVVGVVLGVVVLLGIILLVRRRMSNIIEVV